MVSFKLEFDITPEFVTASCDGLVKIIKESNSTVVEDQKATTNYDADYESVYESAYESYPSMTDVPEIYPTTKDSKNVKEDGMWSTYFDIFVKDISPMMFSALREYCPEYGSRQICDTMSQMLSKYKTKEEISDNDILRRINDKSELIDCAKERDTRLESFIAASTRLGFTAQESFDMAKRAMLNIITDQGDDGSEIVENPKTHDATLNKLENIYTTLGFTEVESNDMAKEAIRDKILEDECINMVDRMYAGEKVNIIEGICDIFSDMARNGLIDDCPQESVDEIVQTMSKMFPNFAEFQFDVRSIGNQNPQNDVCQGDVCNNDVCDVVTITEETPSPDRTEYTTRYIIDDVESPSEPFVANTVPEVVVGGSTEKTAVPVFDFGSLMANSGIGQMLNLVMQPKKGPAYVEDDVLPTNMPKIQNLSDLLTQFTTPDQEGNNIVNQLFQGQDMSQNPFAQMFGAMISGQPVDSVQSVEPVESIKTEETVEVAEEPVLDAMIDQAE